MNHFFGDAPGNVEFTGKFAKQIQKQCTQKLTKIDEKYSNFRLLIDSWNASLKSNNIQDVDMHKAKDFLFLMDNMENEMMKSFNALPDRWIILKDGKIVYKGKELPDKPAKHVENVDKWLQNKLNQKKVE